MAGETEAVEALKKLVEGENNLYLGKTTDETILREFLNLTDFNIDKAFERIKLWFRLKAQNNQFYASKRDPNVHDIILKKEVHMMLPDRDQLGRRVYLFKLGNLVYGAHEPYEMFQVDDIWLTLALQEEETQKNGLVFLFDMDKFSWKFLRYFTPHIIRCSTAKAESIPSKHIQYHIIKAGFWINTIITLVFPFLSQATKEQVFFHKTNESLHTHITPSILPPEYGGTKPPLVPAQLVKDYLDPSTDRLNELLSYGYTEKPSE
ncbi:clavesin-1-like [Macrosteles quadrilineatus]|uniref:clavesin-1-like n=1 Tax=Macrosteles quadrilineatus TaxID=74068 RepID=UPI0023E1FFA0|nr:clavesin-1-like [Macrosteles quadrilineatus]